MNVGDVSKYGRLAIGVLAYLTFVDNDQGTAEIFTRTNDMSYSQFNRVLLKSSDLSYVKANTINDRELAELVGSNGTAIKFSHVPEGTLKYQFSTRKN